MERCAEKTFLQSWAWGDFYIAMGGKIWRFGVYSGSMLIAAALVIKVEARRGTFLFIPHGPVINEDFTTKDKGDVLEIVLEELKSLAGDENAGFIRIAPILPRSAENESIFSEMGFKQSPMHASAYDATWKLDISDSEEELLKNMRKTTRYLIRKNSQNKDISIEISPNLSDISVYQKLNRAVAKRQRFSPFSDDFIKNEFEVFSKNNQALFIFGKYKGEMAAGALVIFWSGIAFYHQAASLGKFSKFSIPYLLQWEAIKEAKSRGCAVYDFWGFTDPEKFPRHPWAGPTLFKTGFGGYKKEYVKAQDFVISNHYWINYIIEKTRKAWRGL